MPSPTLTRQQARELDRRATDEFGLPSLALMENAGRGCADLLIDKLRAAGPVVICCGKGNNAGDGFVIARHLDLRGLAVRVLVWADPEELTGDAGVNFGVIRKSGLPVEVFGDEFDPQRMTAACAGAEWIVDALLGTGARGQPRPPLDAVVRAVNAHPARVLAIDLPSGLDCDLGAPAADTIRADATATFVAPKAGFANPAAAPYLGQVHVIQIGAPRVLVAKVLNSVNQ